MPIDLGISAGGIEQAKDKDPTIAVILSIFIPGAGHLYLEQIAKGLTILFLSMITAVIFPVLPFLIWLYGIYDVYQTAKRMRYHALSPSPPTIAGELEPLKDYEV